MSSSRSVSSAVSERYASALLDLAAESKKLEKVESDLLDLQNMITSSDDLSSVLRSPAIKPEQHMRVLAEVSKKAKFQDMTANFLNVLAKNRRAYAIEAMITSIMEELAQRRGQVKARVESAKPLSAAQQKDITNNLKESLGPNVVLDCVVKPELIGGIIITIGSKMIDDSVARKLDRPKVRMAKANENFANQNPQLKEV